MNFEFATAARIVFGPGTINQVPVLAAEMGCRVLVVTGRSEERSGTLLQQLDSLGIACTTFRVIGEPNTQMVMEGVEQARGGLCDVVVGIGGGSVLDAGKVISALLTNQGDLIDYLEVIGGGGSLNNPAVPYIAVPTTAGTGAEVTRNAVLGSPEHQVKVSIRSPFLLPSVAVIDPELTYSMPPAVTASCGLDALTQLIEAYVSNRANPLTDGICREGIIRVGRSLRRAYKIGDDVNAREDMAMASLCSGLGLTNAKLGAVQGFSSPLGGMFSAPYGSICGRLLPFVIETNVQALNQRSPDSLALMRYKEIARLLTGSESATAEDAVVWVVQLCQELGVPPLSRFGVKPDDYATIVNKAEKSSSMKGNPIKLNVEELTEILKKACE